MGRGIDRYPIIRCINSLFLELAVRNSNDRILPLMRNPKQEYNVPISLQSVAESV